LIDTRVTDKGLKNLFAAMSNLNHVLLSTPRFREETVAGLRKQYPDKEFALFPGQSKSACE
jgi:hypothetical protein